MADTTTKPVKTITESGWYRITSRGWVRVADASVPVGELGADGWDLVCVRFDAEEVSLW